MPSKEDGDDVLQEALLAAFINRDSCRSAVSFKPWLLKIISNKCSDFYRLRAKLQEVPYDDGIKPVIQSSRSGLIVSYAVKETVASLSKNDHQILHMYYREEMTLKEIAESLSIPVGTAKSRLHTAKARFKAAYPFSPK